MASGVNLPPPTPLEIHDQNAAEKWKKFNLAWNSYALATELNKKSEAVQVATLVTVIGEEARDMYSTFTDRAAEGDDNKIAPVLQKFAEYCQPRKNVPFERYRFNCRTQEAGESYDQYKTAPRKLAEGCDFDTITPDEMLRDRLIFGIRDSKVRERLLRESKLSLAKTDEIHRAAESMQTHMKIVGDLTEPEANKVDQERMPNWRKSEKTTRKRQQQGPGRRGKECEKCGYQHQENSESCPSIGQECLKCGKRNHFASRCKSKEVKAADLEDDEAGEMYQIEVAVIKLDDSQLVTLKLESGNFIRFQPDTGAQCNVVPLHVYKKASKDERLEKVNCTQASLVAYGGSKIKVIGRVRMCVWRNEKSYLLNCHLVESEEICPILGIKSCLAMNIIQYQDNDLLNKPKTDGSLVYAIEDLSPPVTKEELMLKFPDVFGEGLGQLDGQYTIRLDETVPPVQHAPRRIAVALRPQLKDTLDALEAQGVIAQVTTPTRWISSIVAVPKKNGKLRICLDPKDLNRAIQREKYQLPTVEDIATRLHGAKVFTVMDVRNGFWHVSLNEESSYLTTFQTPFGRYCWRRMPFGISSAPEVFQRKMHELIEGMTGIEVVADDFIAVGYGETFEEATRDHDKNLLDFLKRCEAKNVRLNPEKLKLRQSQVLFIGHMATDQGLEVDPAKVRAIIEMPAPTDKLGVQRLLGLAQYLAKFLPHLSDVTKPLRDLTQSNVLWVWNEAQQTAFEKLKEMVTRTPVLRYYNLKGVTLQCDASQSGLGAALMQNGQPVAYASRALTPAETRYAQIEKELLAIVFACDRFDAYVYGRDLVNVETDHKPLEPIFVKPLAATPKRLQRMLLRLQKYNLQVRYKKGKEMLLANTLSRAYLPEVNATEFSRELEDIDHRVWLPVTEDRWQQLKNAAADDPVQQKLRDIIRSGWPENRAQVPECVRPYFDVRDELTIQNELVFKRQQIVVPTVLRKELMEKTHA